jgi:predicted Zn-dependent protease
MKMQNELKASRDGTVGSVNVQAGQTVGSLAASMSGVDKKLDLFRVLNALPPGGGVSAGDKVKIITDS